MTVQAQLWLTPPFEVTSQNVGFGNGMIVEISERVTTTSECRVKCMMTLRVSAALAPLHLLASLQSQF